MRLSYFCLSDLGDGLGMSAGSVRIGRGGEFAGDPGVRREERSCMLNGIVRSVRLGITEAAIVRWILALFNDCYVCTLIE